MSHSASKGKKKDKGKAKENINTSNVILPQLTPSDRAELRKCVEMAIKLGYSTVAFNLLLPASFNFDSSIVNALNPCAAGKVPFPDIDGQGEGKILQLNRLTLVLDDSNLGVKGNGGALTSTNAQVLQKFNLISVLPLDSASFSHACLTLTPSVDIITLDLHSSARLPFMLKRSLISKAISEGVMFEIIYSPMLRSANFVPSNSGAGGKWAGQIPKDARRNLIASAKELVRITDGKGIIISSDLRAALEMRGPSDVINLAPLLGFRRDQAKASLTARPRSAVLRGYANRRAFRGVISQPTVTQEAPQSATGDDSVSDVQILEEKPASNGTLNPAPKKRKIG